MVGALAASAASRTGLATALLLLATLTRPEGVLVAAVVFSFRLYEHRWQFRPVLVHGTAYAIGIVALEVFRLWYYGDLLPNTFHAKVGGVPLHRGADYLASFYVGGGAGLLLLPSLVAGWGEGRARAGVTLVAVVSLYVFAVGGDVFPQARFLVPALAVLCGLCVCGVAGMWRQHRALGIALAAVVPIAIGWQLGAVDRQDTIHAIRDRWHSFERLAFRRSRALRIVRPRPRLVATAGIGALGYYTRLPVIDILGLVDPVVATSTDEPSARRQNAAAPGHQRSNADYVFSRRPDVILIPRSGSRAPLPAQAAIWEHPHLERYYRWDPGLRAYRRSTPLEEALSGEADLRAMNRDSAGSRGASEVTP